jgi:hypothetical protein
MNARRSLKSALLAAILVLPVVVSTLSAKETFKARMLTGKTGFGPSQINVRIEIESWTTPEEVNGLLEAMARGGFNAYQDAFNVMKKGAVIFMSDRGRNLPIHAAISLPMGDGRNIRLFLNHQIWDSDSTFVEHGSNPFMVIDFKLDGKGKGEDRDGVLRSGAEDLPHRPGRRPQEIAGRTLFAAPLIFLLTNAGGRPIL